MSEEPVAQVFTAPTHHLDAVVLLMPEGPYRQCIKHQEMASGGNERSVKKLLIITAEKTATTPHVKIPPSPHQPGENIDTLPSALV